MGQIAGPPPERTAQRSGLNWLLIGAVIMIATICLLIFATAALVLMR
jgi:hypothetical protein